MGKADMMGVGATQIRCRWGQGGKDMGFGEAEKKRGGGNMEETRVGDCG